MQITILGQRLLVTVLKLSGSRSALSFALLARESAAAHGELRAALEELARLGLLDRWRLRLTLAGLAMAVAIGAREKSATRRATGSAPAPALRHAPIALFSARETPRAVA